MREPASILDELEDPRFLSEQLVTCIGNKRSLLDFIGSGVERVRSRLGGRRLDSLDAFSGSGIVARFLKRFSRRLIANDLELYADIANRCHLANTDSLDLRRLGEIHQELVDALRAVDEKPADPGTPGFVEELYAPADDSAIKPGERVFYTKRNARYLDLARRLIEGLDEGDRPFFLSPLISEASIHANTSGVFKGFHKDPATGIGRFGGGGQNALRRIRGPITLPFPVFSRFSCEVVTMRGDAVATATGGEVDLAYLDPPYNQHPYGSNYFMLNLIAEGRRPGRLSGVSGIPEDWRRSDYNSAIKAAAALESLIGVLPAKFIVLSFNSEGFVGRGEMEAMLRRHGRLEVLERDYSAFKGSRNLRSRPLRVKEFLYILEKS